MTTVEGEPLFVYTVFKRIELFIEKYIGRTTEVFSPDSKLFQADSLQLLQHHQKLPADLRHFQGRQAFFICHEFNSAVWGDLVRQWKSGEALQNLEYLEATKLHHFLIDEEMMLYEFDAKRIDPTRRPPTHTVPRLFINEKETPNTRPITSHAYVVRETDNRVASVRIWQGIISMGVWDKTEEQFLRMVE
ncbi:hypothetical protein B9Z55_000266 [Caenorhabditis nigoni]|uniref:F-box associated domain-containing protein n=1 Tax=Caenorhabditis nigoni TaxID=1611254 RepID=A0A2G5VLH2_9PELO|nr:hypothetical protein B9Z55_000266 [Caenorhabditis nigoni]